MDYHDTWDRFIHEDPLERNLEEFEPDPERRKELARYLREAGMAPEPPPQDPELPEPPPPASPRSDSWLFPYGSSQPSRPQHLWEQNPYDPILRSERPERPYDARRENPRGKLVPRALPKSLWRIKKVKTEWAARADPAKCGACGRPFCRTCPDEDAYECDRCGMWVCGHHLEDYPDQTSNFSRIWPQVCPPCADALRDEMHRCPNCGEWRESDEQLVNGAWKRCDRCGRAACFSCLRIGPAPQYGMWYNENYAWICSECETEVDEEHERQREEMFATDKEE